MLSGKSKKGLILGFSIILGLQLIVLIVFYGFIDKKYQAYKAGLINFDQAIRSLKRLKDDHHKFVRNVNQKNEVVLMFSLPVSELQEVIHDLFKVPINLKTLRLEARGYAVWLTIVFST